MITTFLSGTHYKSNGTMFTLSYMLYLYSNVCCLGSFFFFNGDDNLFSTCEFEHSKYLYAFLPLPLSKMFDVSDDF